MINKFIERMINETSSEFDDIVTLRFIIVKPILMQGK